jgi:DNA-binding transcriptional MerR regulator
VLHALKKGGEGLELVTIGQFSKICWLSIKALRLYDELELLLPAFIDPRTGYRYYEPAQASRARAIALLRSLEMPLIEIKELLAESDPDKLRRRLNAHRSMLESRLAEHKHMLRRVEQLMRRGELMSYEVKIKEFQPTQVVGITLDTTPEGIGTDAPNAYQQLFDRLGQEGVAPIGAPRLVYHEMGDEVWRIEACVPVGERVTIGDGFQSREVDGGRAATAVHEGPYDELGIAWQELSNWIAAHGHTMPAASRPFDIYLNDPNEVQDPAQYLTELVWPIH